MFKMPPNNFFFIFVFESVYSKGYCRVTNTVIALSLCTETTLGQKEKTTVSENAGDEKNLHPEGRNFIFFNQFD